MADSSFDIVSKLDRQEVDNALGQAAREVATRFDFKGTGASIEWQGQQSKISITLKEGITSEDAKKISKLIRDEGPKGVKAQVQGDELRVSSKKRDDLQAVQALVKAQDYDFAVQFTNYR